MKGANKTEIKKYIEKEIHLGCRPSIYEVSRLFGISQRYAEKLIDQVEMDVEMDFLIAIWNKAV